VAADPKISWPWTVSIVMLPDRRFRHGDIEETGPARGKADTRGTLLRNVGANTEPLRGEDLWAAFA
jgi:hypothetical protein